MPLLAPSSYQPPAHLRSAHLQTILPSVLRRVTVPYSRERIETPDDDFLDLDWAWSLLDNVPLTKTAGNNPPLVILSHGLEGDSRRPYLAGMVRHLTRHGFDCLAWNFRSCSGEMNRQARFYHVGETGDLDLVISHAVQKGYGHIHLIGFSMGGNITLKYLGERGNERLHPAIKRAVTFSVPLDVMHSSRRLEAWDSMIYNLRFSRALKRKVLEKAGAMPDQVTAAGLRHVRTVREFDGLFTAPMHGFRDAEDYYQQSSALPFLAAISVPALIISAKNDPFLSPECFPEALARELPNVYMEFPSQGGHCGFPPADVRNGMYWSEERALAFLKQTL